ncbi:MAG: S1/P1 nuclease, partial [Planctomycetia bacterium]|nr:S1/P1 nuclease [Planctomycetia bacterium]
MHSLFRRPARLLLAAGLALGPVDRAGAWGPHGHRIATRIAEARLTPAAREAVRELLREGDTLVGVSNWADHDGHTVEPDSAPWHYVNVPITAPHYDDRYCPKGGCVVSKVKHYRALLADRDAPKAERARALLFLVHFVEDVHQPLHVGDNRDRGGNLAQVQYFDEGTNLHRVWDSQILDDASRDERAWVARITPMLTPENVAAWSQGDVETWADESLQDAKLAYHFPRGSARPIEKGARLGRDYSEFALPIIRRRLA